MKSFFCFLTLYCTLWLFISGGHLNPAVTLAMVATRKLKLIQVRLFITVNNKNNNH